MHTLDRIATVIVLLLGVGHVAATSVWAPGLNEAAAWFSGSGLALVFAGLLNLCRLWVPDQTARRLCALANLLTLAWIGFIVAVLPAAQALAAWAAVALLTVASLTRGRAGRQPSLG